MEGYALITGAASGIGKALAQTFAKQGHRLVLVSKVGELELLEHQASFLLQQYGVAVSVIGVDLEKPNAEIMVYEQVRQLGIKIQYLVNNAGFAIYGAFLDTSLTDEVEMIHVHVVFMTKMLKLFLPDMIRNGYGRVLNVSSTASYMPVFKMATYAATKAYIASLSKTINLELKGSGVNVTVLCPGATSTDLPYEARMEHTLLYRLFVMKPTDVAATGYKALIGRKAYVIPGIYNKMLVLFSKFVPACVVDAMVKRMLK